MSLLIDATVSNVNQLIKILLLRSLRLSFVRFGVTCDEYSVEFLQNLGPKARTWLSKLFSRIMATHSIPKIWRKAKVIVVEKSGNDPSLAANTAQSHC